MTKKDYVLISRALVEGYNVMKYDTELNAQRALRIIVSQVSFHLNRENPKFDQYKFFQACGL